jgi:signal transduction histidine kinase
VLEHATRLLEPAAQLRRIRIVVRVSDAAAAVPAGSIYPILANALRNSIEAIAGDAGRDEGSGVIEVRAALVRGGLELTVADDGPGLSPALFDEQGRFRFGTTGKPDGHGLGLALCRDIAARQGGTLAVANRTPRGAVLRLLLPVVNSGSWAGRSRGDGAGVPTAQESAADGREPTP